MSCTQRQHRESQGSVYQGQQTTAKKLTNPDLIAESDFWHVWLIAKLLHDEGCVVLAARDTDLKEKTEGKPDAYKDKSADLMKLHGEWLATEGFERDMAIVFDGKNFTLKDGDRQMHGTITLDGSETPKTKDLNNYCSRPS